MAIHNSITQGSLTLGEKAVIDKYGLEVELDGGLYIITDPITDTTSHGAKLDKVLQKAIKIRQDYDKKLEVETSPVLEPTAISTPPVLAKPKHTKSKKTKTEPVVEETVEDAPLTENEKITPWKLGESVVRIPFEADEVIIPFEEEDEVPDVVVDDDERDYDINDTILDVGPSFDSVPDTTPQNDVPIVRSERIVLETITNDVSKNTSRIPKTKEPKKRKDNRYLRAARVVAEDLSMVPEKQGKATWAPCQERLAKAVGDISFASAGHFFEAWVNITAVLEAKGWLKLPK